MDKIKMFNIQVKNIITQINSECFVKEDNLQQLKDIISNICQKCKFKKYSCQFYYFNHSKTSLSLIFKKDYQNIEYLFKIYEIQQKRNATIFKKLFEAFNIYDKEILNIINDKQVPNHLQFFIFDQYLIKQFVESQISYKNKDLIFDINHITKESLPYIRILDAIFVQDFNKVKQIMLECPNLVEIMLFLGSNTQNDENELREILLLAFKNIPYVKNTLHVSQSYDFFTLIEDQYLTNLNLSKLSFSYNYCNDSGVKILKEIDQIQKIQNLSELEISVQIDQNLNEFIKQIDIKNEKKIGRFLNLIKFRLYINSFNNVAFQNYQGLFQCLNNLQNLKSLKLALRIQIANTQEIQEILNRIGEWQYLTDLNLEFNFECKLYLISIFVEEIQKLKNLNILITYFNHFGQQKIQYERKIKKLLKRLVTFVPDIQYNNDNF